jgi:uncharacterized protein
VARIESDGISGFRPNDRTRKGRDTRPKRASGLFPSLFEHEVEGFAPVLPVPGPVSTVEEAQGLLDRIHQLGDQLSREQTFSRLREYRVAVQDFLRSVVTHAVDVQEHTSGTNILNRKRFTLVRIIDQKLERLAAGMFQTQQSQIEMLRKVEEIQGLLVDLFQ